MNWHLQFMLVIILLDKVKWNKIEHRMFSFILLHEFRHLYFENREIIRKRRGGLTASEKDADDWAFELFMIYLLEKE